MSCTKVEISRNRIGKTPTLQILCEEKPSEALLETCTNLDSQFSGMKRVHVFVRIAIRGLTTKQGEVSQIQGKKKRNHLCIFGNNNNILPEETYILSLA